MNLFENTRKKTTQKLTKNERKTRYECQRKKYVSIKPNTGYVAKAIRSFYSDLAGTRNDDPTFVRAVKLASCSYNYLVNT